MSLKSKIVASAVLAAIVGGTASVNAATSVNLNLVYVGSTINNSNNAITKIGQNLGLGMLVNTTNFPNGTMTTASAGLTQYDLLNPSTQAVAGLKNYFAVYLDYVPNAATDQIYGFGFSVNMPKGMAPVSSNGLVDNTTNKFVLFNPIDDNTGAATWETIGDFGDYAGDLQAIGVYQATVGSAQMMMIGQPGSIDNGDNAGYVSGKGTLIGLFALEFMDNSQVVTGNVSLDVVGKSVTWWSSGTAMFDDSAFHGSSVPVGSPEPASLGVLALGGLALLARRRK
jgi:hypothetical protein